MGIKKRDERDKLKSQNLIDSEKTVHFAPGGTANQSVTGTTTDVQQQGSSTMYTSSSTSSSSSKMQSASSSSTSKSVIEHVAASGAHDMSQKMSESKSSTSGGTSVKESQQGHKFSESTNAQIGSKQIDNIIQEIKYIASDTVDSTKRISSVQKVSDSSKSDKELREALTDFDAVAKATISDIQGSTKSHTSENMSVSSVQKSMSSSKMVQSSSTSSTVSSSAIKQHQSSTMSSSEKMISDQSSSSAQHSSSSTMKSSNASSSKTQSSSTSKSVLDSSTFQSDSADIKMLQSDSNLKDMKLTVGGQLRDLGGDHSILQQSSTYHVDGSGGKRYAGKHQFSSDH